jgi:peroxiredoxin
LLRGMKMGAIEAGHPASEFVLEGLDGQRHSLSEALEKGPVVAAFFKVSCPTCQFTFPFLERLHDTYGEKKLTIWGISQDDAADTMDFRKEFDVTLPMLIDDKDYPASNAYGLTNVPSIFLIEPGGKVKVSCVGFEKEGLEAIARELARISQAAPVPFFAPGELVPDYKPG